MADGPLVFDSIHLFFVRANLWIIVTIWQR